MSSFKGDQNYLCKTNLGRVLFVVAVKILENDTINFIREDAQDLKLNIYLYII